MEGLALLFVAGALYGCMVSFTDTCQADLDLFGEPIAPGQCGAVCLAGPVLLVAVLVHPRLNSDFESDPAWTYATLLELVALIPQLYMFRALGVIELSTAYFVAALGFGRLMEFVFWFNTFHEVANSSGSPLPDYLVLFFS